MELKQPDGQLPSPCAQAILRAEVPNVCSVSLIARFDKTQRK